MKKTIVEKDDYDGTLRVYVLEVQKQGTKYLHGKLLDGGHLLDYSIKINREKILKVYDGVRDDVISVVREYGERVKRYREEYERARREALTTANRVSNIVFFKLLEKWEREHPTPEPPELPI